jgi:acyl carrier protein
MSKPGFEALQRVIAREFNVTPALVTRETTAADIDGWDSISHASLIMTIESEFGVVLDIDEAYSVETVGALHDLLSRSSG